MIRRLSVVVLSVVALACHSDRPTVVLSTQGTVFDRGGSGIVPEATVPVTVTNRGDRTVFLPACADRPAVSIERGTGKSWEQYSGTFCVTNLMQSPVELRAGEKLTGTFTFAEPGYYRIRLTWGATAADVFGDDASTSNPFHVR